MPIKDPEKRRRVMQRSMQLGHCICDAKKPCPCDILREQDICPCAGEEPEMVAGPVKLTALIESAGCASKIDQKTLHRILHGLPASDDPRVLVGVPAGDDAGVFLIDEKTALVQTVDVFSPSVDDPYTFGQVAAANSLSDVYAMGGRPLTALSIVGFPAKKLPDEIMREILRGGLDKMHEAAVAVVGGHSIKDNEIKAGFAVTGIIDPQKIATNAAMQPGDCLVLTKPLGTGIIAFAAQIGRATEDFEQAAARSMTALNRIAAEEMTLFEAHACTDVTGFGLMGHLKMMAQAAKVDIELVWDAIPLLPGVLEYAAEGILPGAIERNRESSGEALVAVEGVESTFADILFDAQTSGGLLVALPEEEAALYVHKLHEKGIGDAAIVGRAIGEGAGRVILRGDGRRKNPPVQPSKKIASGDVASATAQASTTAANEEKNVLRESKSMSCCGGGKNGASAIDGDEKIEEIQGNYQAFLGAVNSPGTLDARTKRAMGIALSVLARCAPCVKYHVGKAKSEGFSEAEIEEAAWMGIAFGGSPTMMFYNEMKKK